MYRYPRMLGTGPVPFSDHSVMEIERAEECDTRLPKEGCSVFLSILPSDAPFKGL